MKKRIICIMLVVTMVLGMFTGCGKKGASNGTFNGTLRVGVPQNTSITSYEENALTKYIEESLGMNLEFEYYASGAGEQLQQLTLAVSAGEQLPDVLLGFISMEQSTVNAFGEDGVFLDLTDLIEQYGVNYKAQMAKLSEKEQKTIQQVGTNAMTGEFYGMPLYGNMTVCDNMQTSMYINQAWLDAVGMSAPTTVDELYQVLKAFKTQDPNGNGKQDEVPMLSAGIWNYIINAFVYYDEKNYINITDGKAWDPITTDAYRDAMIFINKLCEEELLSDLSFTSSATDIKSLVSGSGKTARVGMWCGHAELSTSVSSQVVDQYTAIAPLKGATELGGYGVVRPGTLLYSSFITKDCSNTEAAMKLLDFFYTDEMVTRVRHGAKDVDWKEGSGDSSFLTKSTIEIINPNALHSGNSTWGHNCHGIMTAENYLSIAQTGEGRWAECARLLKEQTQTMIDCKKPEEVAVHLVYNEDEYEILTDVEGARNSYVSEARALFAMGNKNPSSDADWNEYLKTLEEYENSKLTEVCQSAYDRQQK